MLLTHITQVLKCYLSILLAFFVFALMIFIYWTLTGFHGDLWPKSSFVLLLLLSSFISIILTGLYFLIYFVIGNGKHLSIYTLFLEICCIIIIYYISINQLENMITPFFPRETTNGIINKESPMITYLPIVYLTLLSTIFFFTSFLIRKRINK